MKKTKILVFLLLIVMVGFTSCLTSSNMKSIQVEILYPSIIKNPEEIDTIAIFKRDRYQSDTLTFMYSYQSRQKSDTTIQYRDLSNTCVDALADYLNNKGYFIKVVNYRDSMNYLFLEKDSLINYLEFYKKSGFDACIFLDRFNLEDYYFKEKNYWTSGIKDDFQEFANSTELEKVCANLLWTVSFNGDKPKIVYKQIDCVFYGNSINPEFFGNTIKHNELLKNTSLYLGKNFGEELTPSWKKSERSYYHSGNANMLKAEKYCLDGDWRKAAEIYNKETKNKNKRIAVQAKYNMAFVCEMEGNHDAALDWLKLSFSTYKHGNEEHKSICKQYFDLLTMRKQEIESLEKQDGNCRNKE